MSKADFRPYSNDAEAILEARKHTRPRGLADPYRSYLLHRNGARIRGIEWRFSFATWWQIWQPYYHMRGRGTNSLCMARELDEGPYSPENVYLTTHLGNARDAKNSKKNIERRQKTKEGREARFSRQSSNRKIAKNELRSNISLNRSSESDKYACNITQGDLKFE